MNTMTKSNRWTGNLRGAALAAALAGGLIGAVAVPALAQESVTTTRTTATYDYDGPATTTYYERTTGPTYYETDSYAYPPAPVYVEPAPPPPAVGVGISVPFVHVGVGF